MDYLSLLVGAGLAITGGLISQLVAFYLKRNETRSQYRRDKMDLLMVSLLEDQHWLETLRQKMCFTKDDLDTAEPFDRVGAIVHLYFREDLSSKMPALIEARLAFNKAIRQTRADRITTAIKEQKDYGTVLPTPENTAAVLAAFKVYATAAANFQTACSNFAKENF